MIELTKIKKVIEIEVPDCIICSKMIEDPEKVGTFQIGGHGEGADISNPMLTVDVCQSCLTTGVQPKNIAIFKVKLLNALSGLVEEMAHRLVERMNR